MIFLYYLANAHNVNACKSIVQILYVKMMTLKLLHLAYFKLVNIYTEINWWLSLYNSQPTSTGFHLIGFELLVIVRNMSNNSIIQDLFYENCMLSSLLDLGSLWWSFTASRYSEIIFVLHEWNSHPWSSNVQVKK